MRKLYLLAAALLCTVVSFAQITVTVTNPTNATPNLAASYSSLASALTDLNAVTSFTGPVSLTCATGSETAPVGGYQIKFTAAASAANNVVIDGGGSTVTAGLQVAGGIGDAVFQIVGSDYVTLKNFIMKENTGNTVTTAGATNTMTEFGVLLVHASATDGAQNNTIQGNTITLNSSYVNSVGIFSTSSSLSTALGTAQDATSTAGTNSNNKFYGNNISNVAYGIYLICPPVTATVTESGNDIGGSSVATGNTITFGNAAASTGPWNRSISTAQAGILYRNGAGVNISYNSITSNTLTYVGTAGLNGVMVSSGTAPVGVTYSATMSNNTVTLNSTGVAVITAIDFGHGISTATLTSNSNNIIITNSQAAANSAAITGIKANYVSGSNTSSNNSVAINQTFSPSATATNSSALVGITLAGATTTMTANTNAITFNQVHSPVGTTSGTLSATITALSLSGTSSTTNALNNTILVNRSTSMTAAGTATQSGAVVGISATSAATTLNIGSVGNGNTITIKESSSATGTSTWSSAVTYIDASAGHGTANIVANNLNTTGSTIRSTGAFIGVKCEGTVTALYNVKSNTAVIDRVAASGNVAFTSQTGSPSNVADTISNNSITFTNLATTGTIAAISQLGGPTGGGSKSICNNTISISATAAATSVKGIVWGYTVGTGGGKVAGNNITISCAAATVIGIDGSGTSASGGNGITQNTLSLTSSSTSPTSMIGINGAGTGPYQIYNNTFSTLSLNGVITSSPVVSGIQVSAGTGNAIYSNVVTNISVGAATSTGSPTVDGILVSGSTSTSVYKNKIYGISTLATGTTTVVNGIRLSGGTTNNVYNNLIGSLQAGAAASPDAIRGIAVTSTTTSSAANVYYNTIYLNASSSGVNFGTTGVYHAASATATTAALDLRNNIIINTSTPAGTGITTALRRSAAALGNYASTSNKNLLYAGATGVTRLIMYDGTNSYQTLATYQTAVSARDNASFTGESSFDYAGGATQFFQSTVGSNANFLHIVAGTTTQVESGGSPITTPNITDDYDGDTRNATKPDVGADEFNGQTPAPSVSLNTPTGNCSAASVHTITATVNTPVGTIANNGVSLTYNNGSSSTVTMNYVSGSGTGPYVFTYDIPAASPVNSQVTWSVTATNSLAVNTTATGTSYQDVPLTGYTATATSSNSAVCVGTTTVLTGKLSKIGAGTTTVGAGGSTSSTSGSPFYHGWGGSQTQYIVLASELTAAGLSAGPITSLGLDVTAIGSGTFNGFAVSMGLTTQTSFATANAITTGVNQVYQGTGTNNSVTLTVGVNTFPVTGFTWDGTSNIVVKFCWSNNNTGGTSATVKTDTYASSLGMYIYSDSQTPATLCGATTTIPASGGSSTTTTRPKFVIGGTVETTLPNPTAVWSDGTSTVGTNNPQTVTVNAATSYSASLTYNGCSATTNTVAVALSAGLTPGTYSIGAGSIAGEVGHYATLTAAVADYNTKCLSGAVTFALTDATYSSNETFPIVINGNATASASNTLTIKPNTGANPTLSGSVADALIKLNSAKYVTIDGSNNGTGNRNLTINNSSSTPVGVAIVSNGLSNGTTNSTIKNSIITSSANAGTGISVGGSSAGTNGADNDNITIQNNAISGVATGIFAAGTTTVSAGADDNLNISQNSINISSTVAVKGIQVGNALTSTIGQDTLSVETTSTGAVGISIETGFLSSTVSRNLVIKTVAGATGGYGGRGIAIGTGSAASNLVVVNNVIYGVNGSNYSGFSNSSSMGIGIGVQGSSTTVSDATGGVSLYHNSVYLSGDNSTGSQTGTVTAALYVGSAATALDIRNNVFANNINNQSGSSKNYGLYSAAAASAFTTLNYNSYYGPGTTNSTFYVGYLSGDQSTIASWRTATSKEANSIATDPTLNGATNLRPQPGSPLVGAGTPIGSVTIDFLGTSRSGTAPTIGAYEGTIDLQAPIITFTAFTFNCSTADKTFTATITDGGGVATGSLAPRVYYKKGVNGTWASAAGNLSSGTVNNGNWDFTIPAASLSVAVGDSLYYYVIAQDVAATPNISSKAAGVTATNVNTVTVHPASPNYYVISATLIGTYSIGTGNISGQSGHYPTLTAAIASYNTSCISGGVIFALTDANYSTGETFPITINANSYANASNTLTIKPAIGVDAVISASVAAGSVIKLDGADYVTINGSNNGSTSRNLTIRNTTTTTSGNTVVWLGSAGAGNGATYNTIKNAIIEGDASTTTFSGVFMGSNSTIGLTAGGNENNNGNTFDNNLFRKMQYGLVFFGYAAASPDNNNVISNNKFGTYVTGEGFNLEGIHTDRQNNLVVAGNEVQNVTGTSGTTMYGIRLLDFKNGQAYNNKVHDISYTGISTTKNYGIAVVSSTYTTVGNPSTALIYNNVVYNINSTGTSAVWNATGILAGQGYGDRYYYNSVNMGGQINNSTSGLSAAFAIGDGNITTGATNADVRNNIFVVSGSSATGGSVWAYYTVLTSNTGVTSDNNIIRSAGTGATNYTGRFNGSNYSTLATWKTGFGLDANSLESDPLFNSATVLVPSQGSPAVGAGTPLPAVTTDILGQPRSVTAPTIGAYENAGDGMAPTITYTPLAFTCSTGARILTATITDASGVPTSGSLVPRIYFKNGTGGTWYSQPGTLASGTATNGTWNFNINTAVMGGVSVGDQIYYYVVAQDVASTVNIGSSPAGVTASDVQTVTATPLTLNSYAINVTLAGTYSVGAANLAGEAGHYATLTSAIAAYNSACLSGAVTFKLVDPGYNTNETFPLVINSNPYASASNNLTIKPNDNTDVTISAPATSTSVAIQLNGADYVTIDGVHDAAGTNLSVVNPSTNSGTAVIWLTSTGAGQGATNNTLKNLTIKGAGAQNAATPITTYGIVISGTTLSSTITSISAGADNDSNRIDTCTFTKLRYAIFSRGGSTTNPNLGTTISRNVIGPAAFGVDQIGKAGIVVREEDSIQIVNNEIRFVGGDYANIAAGSTRAGIAFATDASWTPTTVLVKRAKVTGNLIHDIQDERSSAAVGIILGGVDGTNNTSNIIANNFIYSIKSNGISGSNQAVGIGVASGKGDKVVYNSIYLTGNVATGSAATPTVPNFGIRVSSTSATNLSIVNNAVVMDLTGTGAAASWVNSCIDLPTGYSFGTDSMNYNNWYPNPANSQAAVGTIANGGTPSATIGLWRSASGQDGKSLQVDPMFASATDLHLQQGSPLDGSATPLTTVITKDIDNQTRSTLTPDIGADELPPSAGLDIKPSLLVSPAATSFGCYGSSSEIKVKVLNNGSSTAFFNNGTPLTVTVAVSGAATANYSLVVNNNSSLLKDSSVVLTLSTAGTLLDMSAAGTYIFDITTSIPGDVNVANDALHVELEKKPLTVGTLTASPAEYCAVGGKPTLTSAGANGYSGLQWQSSPDMTTWTNIPGATGASYTAAANITASTFYKLVATCDVNTDESVVSVVINNPQPLSTTPGTRCGTGTVQLQATANATDAISWYSAATGGVPVGTGSTFTTPVISATTPYFVSVASNANTFNVGVTGEATSSLGSLGNYGMYFKTVKTAKINSVKIYPSTAGTLNVTLKNAGGTVVDTRTFTITAADISNTVQKTLALNFLIPANSTAWTINYDLAIYRGTGSYTYPQTANGFSITGNTLDGNNPTTGTRYYFWDWNVTTVDCEGTRVQVDATVTSAPALTSVSATPATICAGQSSTLNVSSGNSNYTYSWSPAGSGASLSVTPSATTAYTVTATDAGTGCVTTGTTTVTVNEVPSAIVFTPSSVSVCPGSSAQPLAYTGGTLPATATIGTGTTQNTTTSTTDMPPYGNYYTGNRHQILILASELSAAGLTAGKSITALAFDVVSNTNALGYNGFTIKMGHTAATALTTTFLSPAMTTVYTTANFSPTVGWSTHQFTTGFVWDGTSNVLVETYFSNCPSGGCSGTTCSNTGSGVSYTQNAVTNLTATPFVSHAWYYSDANGCSPETQATATTTSSNRPNMRLSFTNPVTYTWTPATGLFTDAAATTAYVGGSNVATVYAKPSSTSTYTLTSTTAATCYTSNSVTVNVNSAVTASTTLAGTQGGASVCSNYDVAISNNYFDNCNLIATVTPNGGAAVSGVINSCVKIDNTVLTTSNGQPYVQRHFDITPASNATTATSRITLYFKQAEFTAYNTARGAYPALPTGAADASGIANLRVTQFNGTGTIPGNYTGTPTLIDPVDADIAYDATADRWSVSFNVTGSGGFYVHTANWILPVTIVSFKGENAGSVNKLYWTTSTEVNSKGFELERSADGVRYTKVDFIATKANGGNSTSALNYTYDDVKPLLGANYYRLKQIDNDGKYNYSNVVLLNRKVTEITIAKVFPNPASTELNVQIVSPRSEKLTLIVTDLSGKVVMQHPMNVVMGDNQQQLQIGALAGGTYVIKAVCANGCETSVLRFVKQ